MSWDPRRGFLMPGSASTRRPIRPARTIASLLAALGVERAVLVQPSVYGADNTAMLDAMRQFGPGVRAVAVTDPAISEPEIQNASRRRRARIALQRGRPARRQERGAGHDAARCRQARRAVRLAYRASGECRRGEGFRRRHGGYSGSDRARPSRLSEVRRAAMDQASGLRRHAPADRQGPLLDQAHRPLSHHRHRRRALTKTSMPRPTRWSRPRRSAWSGAPTGRTS